MDQLSNLLPENRSNIGTMVFQYSIDRTSVSGIVSHDRLRELAERLLDAAGMISPIHSPGLRSILVGHGYGGLICEQVRTGHIARHCVGLAA
jgi:hypothetical protein